VITVSGLARDVTVWGKVPACRRDLATTSAVAWDGCGQGPGGPPPGWPDLAGYADKTVTARNQLTSVEADDGRPDLRSFAVGIRRCSLSWSPRSTVIYRKGVS